MKILVANRGEIAVRIIRACRMEGIETVAVYSEVDRKEQHVRMAHDAVCLGPPPPGESYLAIEKIVAAAKATGADAIHPGYGFLSENADFAQAVADAGLTFIGPSADSIRRMGDKIAARAAMESAGVPVVPGTLEPLADRDEAVAKAEEIGYPVMLKAVGGGGGKGIRVVRTPEELPAAFDRASSEARSAFGNASMYLERYLENPRHIEVQVLADSHGNVIHLGERECSIQRRHQKVVEEAPSAVIGPEERARIGDIAVKAAAAIGYVNAGTIEMLMDRDRNFYFLEMNTRLQVEHPVTEMVYRVDLVREQIRIARGEKLSLTQADVQNIGHAIEVRIYAEDPQGGFLPSAGKIEHLELPGGPGIRLDTNLYEGQEVSLYYDPILGKLIAFGDDRETAILRLEQALREFTVTGIRTTIPFLLRVLGTDEFRNGDFDTGFVDRYLEELTGEGPGTYREVAAIGAVLFARAREEARRPAPASGGNGRSGDGWLRAGRGDAVRRGGFA